jgi:hypothetical protein
MIGYDPVVGVAYILLDHTYWIVTYVDGMEYIAEYPA